MFYYWTGFLFEQVGVFGTGLKKFHYLKDLTTHLLMYTVGSSRFQSWETWQPPLWWTTHPFAIPLTSPSMAAMSPSWKVIVCTCHLWFLQHNMFLHHFRSFPMKNRYKKNWSFTRRILSHRDDGGCHGSDLVTWSLTILKWLPSWEGPKEKSTGHWMPHSTTHDLHVSSVCSYYT